MKFHPSSGQLLFKGAALFICVLILYSFVLPASFRTLDDQTMIVDNPLLKDWSNVPALFRDSFFGKGIYYRPLVSLSYMLDLHLFGPNPFFFYLENILLHGLNALVLMLLVTRLSRSPAIGWWTGFLFAIHPVHWEAVANISGRSILLAALFGLLSFLFLVRTRQGKKGGFRSVFFFALALLCKESAVMLPFVFAAYLWLVDPYEKRSLRRFALKIEAYFLVLVIYFVLRHALHITVGAPWADPRFHLAGVLTFLRGLFTYVRLLLVPAGLHFDRSAPLIGFGSFGLWATLISLLVTAELLRKNWSRFSPFVKLCLIWPLLELLPVSQIFAPVGTIPGRIAINEQFLYLSAAGICCLIVVAVGKIYEINKSRKLISANVFKIITASGILALALFTVQQAIYASSEAAMYRRSLSMSPMNSRIRNALAKIYADKQKYDLAEAEYRAVLSYDPENIFALVGFAQSVCDQGREEECLQIYLELDRRYPGEKLVRGNLSSLYRKIFKRLQQQVREEPLNADLHYRIGTIYAYLKYPDDAMGAFANALKINDAHTGALTGMAGIHESKGQWEQALRFYAAALSGIKGPTPDIVKEQGEAGIRRIYERLGRAEMAEKLINELLMK